MNSEFGLFVDKSEEWRKVIAYRDHEIYAHFGTTNVFKAWSKSRWTRYEASHDGPYHKALTKDILFKAPHVILSWLGKGQK